MSRTMEAVHILALWYPVYTGLFIFASFVVCGRRACSGRNRPNAEHYCIALAGTGIYMLGNAFMSHLLKGIVRQPRPDGDGFGFPSAHACWASGLAVSLLLELNLHMAPIPRHLGAVILFVVSSIAAGIVCWSRITSNAHTEEQVVWGAVIGVSTALLWWQIERATRLLPSRLVHGIARPVLTKLKIWA